MGGSSKGGDTTGQAEQSQTQIANSLSGLLTQQEGQGQQLFNLAFPGLQQSENFSQALASGSPNLIASVTAPAAQQVQQATAGAKQNILNTSPAGGERNLALEQADVSQGSQIGQIASTGYLGAQNTLATLGQSGIGLGQNATGLGIQAGSAASQQYSHIVQQNIQQKGATLGAAGGLASSVVGLATGK